MFVSMVEYCIRVSVTVRRRKHESDNSIVVNQCIPQLTGLEEAANHGHSALSRYRRHGKNPELEHSLERTCSEHLLAGHASAQSNMVIAKSVRCWVSDADLYLHLALAARPASRLDPVPANSQMALWHPRTLRAIS